MKSTSLNQDIPLRNNMQTSLGESSIFVIDDDSDSNHVDNYRKPSKRPTANQRSHHNRLTRDGGMAIKGISSTLHGDMNGNSSRSCTSSMTDSMFGKSKARPSQTGGTGNNGFYEQFSEFRDTIYQKINNGDTRQTESDTRRMWRLFKILCGRKDDVSECITTIATDVLTRSYQPALGCTPDYRSNEARQTSVILEGIDQMIACLLSEE